MKGRESGMPAEEYWATFFDAEAIVRRLFSERTLSGGIVEFGCGYGTFTFPAARRTSGLVTALDIDADMVAHVQKKQESAELSNIMAEQRDFVRDGTGLPSASQAHAMIYNLLHLENPVGLLKEAHRVLLSDGELSVMHWRSDIPTPRGPSLSIRPTPEQCQAWMREAGFTGVRQMSVEDCGQYHFALVASP